MAFIHVGAARQDRRTQYHNGLPQSWNRDRFRQLCVSYAQIQGCTAECVRTLEIIIDLVSPTAFTDPHTEPYCYARQDTLVGGRLLTNKSIYNHERQLEQIGLIDRRLGANGSRCSRKKLGLYLTPAMNIIPEMLEAAAAIRAERDAHDTLRGDRSRLLRHVKVSLETLSDLGLRSTRIETLKDAFLSWPRSDKLVRMSLEALASHVDNARELLLELMQVIQDSQKLPSDISGQPEAGFGCHIQDQIEERIMSCNPQGEDKRSSANASDSEIIRAAPDGAPDCLEKQDGEAAEDSNPGLLLPRISNGGLYALASEEMRMHIDIAGGGEQNASPSLYAIETGVWTRLSEIGTNISAWHEALEAMGLLGAIVAGVLTDAKVTDPKQRVANPGGYLRGMTRAAQKDELNLIAGWMGLVARRTREEGWE
jgi:replication initiation protein RepC